MGFEAGKTRLECVGDVEESADLIAYYCDQMELNDGFTKPMNTLGPDEENVSVLRPYGVWAVISPFNFPLALAAGPAGGALVAGNTWCSSRPASTPYIGLRPPRS
jgi:1-pyrroline-5-carboxylate dehydrogenase